MDFNDDEENISVCSDDDDDVNTNYVQDYVDDKRVEDFLNLLNPEIVWIPLMLLVLALLSI